MAASDDLGEAYASMLLRYHWAWFVTLTFRPKHESASGGIHPEKADKAFRWWASNLNRCCWGKNWHRQPHGGVVWARGQEFHKSGRIHFHAVMAAPEHDLNTLARRLDWMDVWHREYGIARIEPPKSQADISRYVSKYVVKEGEVDFSPNFGRYVPPALDFGDASPPRLEQRDPTLYRKLLGTGGDGEPRTCRDPERSRSAAFPLLDPTGTPEKRQAAIERLRLKLQQRLDV